QPMAYTNIELLTWNVDEPPISRPFIQEAYFAKTDDKQFITGVSLRALAFEFPPYQSLRSDDPNILYSTPILVSTIDKRLKGYARGFPSNESLLFEEDVDKLNLGTSPVFWFGRFQNNVKSINILKSRGKTGVNIFVNQFFDSNPNISTSFKLIKGGKIIKTGNLPNASERSFLQLYSGKLFQKTLEISYPYRLNKIKGKTVVSATFTDNSQGNSDLNPPYFGDFGIYSNGEKTHSLSHGGMNQIRFTLFDERNPDHLETKAFIRRSRAIEDEWQPMPLTQSGNLFQADLSRFSNGDALYSLKITATDENNNSLSVKMLPAFMVGNPVLTLNGVISPSTVLPGQSVIIQVTVQDPTNILQVKATINSPEEHPIEVIELFNDGKHEDRQRQDHVYGNIWTTLRQERTYAIDVMVVSTSGDTLIQKNFITFATSNANPLVFDLQQNYPNPFNPTTAIPFSLGETSLTRLRIYNERGQLIRTLLDEKRGPGKHTVLWDGKNDHRLQVASGLYFYQLKTPKFTSIRKMILLR
ncbi:MAG: T9SS type A sorting domain-containing protein, partial [Nitrospinales bacterium]